VLTCPRSLLRAFSFTSPVGSPSRSHLVLPRSPLSCLVRNLCRLRVWLAVFPFAGFFSMAALPHSLNDDPVSHINDNLASHLCFRNEAWMRMSVFIHCVEGS
ncbi:hypothetical protein VIGAN_01274100, partial [Vigna angularis var. angularis]